jgi:hypothetical protein
MAISKKLPKKNWRKKMAELLRPMMRPIAAAVQQVFTPAPNVKIMINLGALLDIPTGTFLEGRHGEYILNAGLSPLTGVVGNPNYFKSTIMHFMMLCALSRMIGAGSSSSTNDTETNIQEWHLAVMARQFEEFYGEDVIDSGRWVITDNTVYTGDEWYKIQKDFLAGKLKDKNLWVETPFWNRDRTGPFMMLVPTFTEMDSFTKFETSDVIDMQDKNDLGDSGGNTIHMRQGLAKMRFLMEAPRINCGAYNYLLMSAHLGKETMMQNAGPGGQVPVKKMQHLKNGDKIKGVTDMFLYITHNCWHSYDVKALIDQNNKTPLYPRSSDDNTEYDTDLNAVTIRNLRGKSGITGMPITLIVSQSEGVQPSLTEFHYLKEMKYGLEGSNISYATSLYPECKIGRTTVRGKLKDDPKLRRAVNILAEMCQIEELWNHVEEGMLCTPKELYEDLKAKGYDWDMLLATRGWWTVNNDQHPIPFLSTWDLLRMRKGLYHPYWLEDDKKTMKKGFHGS